MRPVYIENKIRLKPTVQVLNILVTYKEEINNNLVILTYLLPNFFTERLWFAQALE